MQGFLLVSSKAWWRVVAGRLRAQTQALVRLISIHVFNAVWF